MKVTKKTFKLFKKEVKRLFKVWGLMSYELYVEHEDIDESIMAHTQVDLTARQAVITLSKKSDGCIPIEKLNDYALHETLETLFWRLESFAGKAYKDDAREEVHAIIQTIINVVREAENKSKELYDISYEKKTRRSNKLSCRLWDGIND
jgi:hypothetical protein